MRYLMVCVLLGAVSCGPVTSPDELGEMWPVVSEEWSVAYASLEELGVQNTGLVKPSMFTWRFYDGPVPCGSSHSNGCFTHPMAIIRVNTQTPHVIRHEAGHAILWFLDHRCFKCISIDGAGAFSTVSLHSGCEDNDFCRRWIWQRY